MCAIGCPRALAWFGWTPWRLWIGRVLCGPSRGRSQSPAYEPSMMAELWGYAYARGVRMSGASDRAGVGGGRRVSRDRGSAGARSRDDRAPYRASRASPGQLFGAVLGLCAQAGLVRSGLVAIDGTSSRRTPAASRPSITSGSRARSSRRPRLSTPPRTTSSARRAATSCRPSWLAARAAPSGWWRPSGAWTSSAPRKCGRSRDRGPSG